jgi:MarR family transcriptional regulator, organic hydroperoxide resistance regulator
MRTTDVFARISQTRSAISDFLARELEEAGFPGLCPSHGDILFALFKEDGRSMGELAAAIRRKKNTATVLVAKLEKEGYLSALPDPADGRRVIIRLTKAGAALREPFARISRRLHDAALSGVTEAELASLREILSRIQENLET